MRILVIFLIIFVHSHITYGRLTAPTARDTAGLPRFIMPAEASNSPNTNKTDNVTKTRSDNVTQNVKDVEKNRLVEEVNKILGDVSQLPPTGGAEATLLPLANLIIAMLSLVSSLFAPVVPVINQIVLNIFSLIVSIVPEITDQVKKMLPGLLGTVPVASSP